MSSAYCFIIVGKNVPIYHLDIKQHHPMNNTFSKSIVNTSQEDLATSANSSSSSNNNSNNTANANAISSTNTEAVAPSATYLYEFIANSALDIVEDIRLQNNSFYLKVVDSFNDILVSAAESYGQTTMFLLHGNTRNEEAIKNFFQEVDELLVKTMMNPFRYGFDSPIVSRDFDRRVKDAVRRNKL